jgi:2-polyprenyl-3-methyl-5-hydroxy-6-metoxy-1,4-benzoquinol methylase
MSVVSTPCPLCGHNQYLAIYHLPDFDILKCRHCGLLARDKQLSLKKIKELYSKNYFLKQQKAYFAPCLDRNSIAKKENYRIHDFLSRLSTLNILTGKLRKKIFDIGCATGTFLELCREDHWSVAGNDVSDFAVSKAKQKNLDVTECTMEAYRPNGIKYSAVTGWEVVPNFERPDIAFAKIEQMIKPNGILAIQLTVTDSVIFYLSHLIYLISGGRWNQLVARGYPVNHAHHFTRKTLKKFLRKFDFTVIKEENIEFNFRYSYFPKILLPVFNIVSIIGRLTGKTTQYRVYAKKIARR